MKLPWPSDDKTKVVDSLRKRQTAEDDARDSRKTVAVNKAGDAGSEKTVPIESQSQAASRTEVARSDSSGRLSWPARDSAPVQRGNDRPPGRSASRDEETRLYTPHGSAAEPEAASLAGTSHATPSPQASDDPVVGWLVIIEGPGKGRSFELGYGANSIGRDKGQKVKLDFGDPHISREKHATLVHDPKSMRFFLQTGDVRNLTYLGDEVVLNPVQLTGREIIMVGGTKLMFVPLCGPDLGWS